MISRVARILEIRRVLTAKGDEAHHARILIDGQTDLTLTVSKVEFDALEARIASKEPGATLLNIAIGTL